VAVTILLIAAAYLSGSLPFGVWFAHLAGVDVQRSGSGNIGATNVARTSGWCLGVLTLLSDALKGLVPVLVAQQLLFNPWSNAAVGLAAVCGHVFPCFLRFRGGKGVATALGVFLATAPAALAIATFVFVLTAVATRYVSLASMLATVTIPLSAIGLGYSAAVQLLGILVAILVIWRHAENIHRLIAGREPRFRSNQ
jgi:glycerol-3-phosphate acyltransferase PlsY